MDGSNIINFLNTFYCNTIGTIPVLKDTPQFSAFGTGFLITYGLTRVLQSTAKKFIPNYYNDYLPIIEKNIEKYAPKIILGGALIYAFFEPQQAKEFWMHHPVFIPGIAGLICGGYTATSQDAHKKDPVRDFRPFFKDLEDTLK